MAGDTTLFAREDYVEEAWRIVDPVLRANTPVYEYEPGTWGPSQAPWSTGARWGAVRYAHQAHSRLPESHREGSVRQGEMTAQAEHLPSVTTGS